MEKFSNNCNMLAAKAVEIAFNHPTLCVISALLLLTKTGRAVLFLFLIFGTPIVVCMRIIPMIKEHGWQKQALIITLIVIVCLNLPAWQAVALIAAVTAWWFKKGRYMVSDKSDDENEGKEAEEDE